MTMTPLAETARDPTRSPGSRPIVVERRGTTRGAMPPLHARAVDETYYVVDGRLTFFVGSDIIEAGPGAVVVAPRNVARAYRIESPAARWLVETSVSSPTPFEAFGSALGRPCGDLEAAWATPEDEAVVMAIAVAAGVEVLGPPGTLPAAL